MRLSYKLLIALVICVALAFTSIKPILSYKNSVVLDDLKMTYPDTQAEKELAETYWSKYPDVGDSLQYGRSGEFGVYGARHHFQAFGQHENRIWPE